MRRDFKKKSLAVFQLLIFKSGVYFSVHPVNTRYYDAQANVNHLKYPVIKVKLDNVNFFYRW